MYFWIKCQNYLQTTAKHNNSKVRHASNGWVIFKQPAELKYLLSLTKFLLLLFQTADLKCKVRTTTQQRYHHSAMSTHKYACFWKIESEIKWSLEWTVHLSTSTNVLCGDSLIQIPSQFPSRGGVLYPSFIPHSNDPQGLNGKQPLQFIFTVLTLYATKWVFTYHTIYLNINIYL